MVWIPDSKSAAGTVLEAAKIRVPGSGSSLFWYCSPGNVTDSYSTDSQKAHKNRYQLTTHLKNIANS